MKKNITKLHAFKINIIKSNLCLKKMLALTFTRLGNVLNALRTKTRDTIKKMPDIENNTAYSFLAGGAILLENKDIFVLKNTF